MEDKYPDGFSDSPMRFTSFETTPERFSPSSSSEPVSSSIYQSPFSSPDSYEDSKTTGCTRKFGRKKAPSFAYRVCEHVKMGSKLSEIVKGKLSLGARIIQEGGRENVYKQIFGVSEGEELLKASQCYLSTTAGPIAGLVFISTHKVAFCSERSITFPSPNGQFIRAPYKVLIPIKKVKRANRSENVEKPAQKYIEIITEDGFEFWFMGFLRYEKAFKNLQKAISISLSTS